MQGEKSRRSIIMSAASMLMMLSCLGHGWAQSLSAPHGLALDASGNLYVTNINTHQVLVYNPNYVQQAGKLITLGLSEPMGIAFDSKGNIYVANLTGNGGTGSVTQYSSAGVLNTRFSITDHVSFPVAITVDGVDNLYVVNDVNVTVYSLDDTINGPFRFATISFPPLCTIATSSWCAIAVHTGNLYLGTTDVNGGPPFWEKGFVGELLAGSGGFPVFQATPNGVAALATDRAGDLYVATGNGEVDVWGPKGKVVFLSQLSFTPSGIVVDSARGRVYLCNQQGSQVLVYSTKGTLLHTIQ